MKRLFIFALCAALLLSISSCAATETPSEAASEDMSPEASSEAASSAATSSEATSSEISEEESEMSNETSGMLDKGRVYHILFIGNSYTFFNDMPLLFKYAAGDMGFKFEVQSVTYGGYTLERFADPTDELGAQVEKLLAENSFDFVFLQEQSSRPAHYPQKFYAAARQLDEKITASGAETVLFQTWGWRDGSADLASAGWTTEEMEKLLSDAYTTLGKELDVKVSPAGEAMLNVYKSGKTNVYNSDNSHPSLAGSFLTALTHIATLTGVSPVGCTYRPTGMLKSESAILCQAAHDAVFGE